MLRYVPYLKDEKGKIQRFISGFPVAFHDMIEFDEPRSLEEAIKKINHFYENLKHKVSWKVNENTKGNFLISKEDLKMHVTRKMWNLTRSAM